MRDLTFSKLKKRAGGGQAPRAVDRLLKRLGGGGGLSIVGLKKQGGGVYPPRSPPTYGPGDMPGAQHIHLNLFFFFLKT